MVKSDGPISVFQWEGDLGELADWFGYYHRYLCQAEFPRLTSIDSPGINESLAQAMRRSYSSVQFIENDAALEVWADNVREPLRIYREAHLLRRALRGYRVPPLLIGLNHGIGEISLSPEDAENVDAKVWDQMYSGDWSYSFDMEDFCQHLRRTLHQILTEWRQSTNEEISHGLATTLLKRLEVVEPT